MTYILLLLIKIYQWCISPWLGTKCRFYPSCSLYAAQSIKNHGTLIGVYLSVKRILRCNPFFLGGFDPSPKQEQNNEHVDHK